MRSPRMPGGSNSHFAGGKEHPQTTLLSKLDEVEQGQRRRLQPYCSDHDYLPFFFFALLLLSCLLIVEFVEGPIVEGRLMMMTLPLVLEEMCLAHWQPFDYIGSQYHCQIACMRHHPSTL